MAITPDYIDGAEHGVATPNTNGGGIANTIGAAGASPTIQGTTKKTGSFAYRHNVAVAGTCYIRKTIWDASDTIVWGSFWFRMDTEINSTGPIAAVGVAAGVIAQIRWDVTNNRIAAFFTGGTNQTGTTNLSLSTWYRVAWEMDVSGGTSSLLVVLYDTTGAQLDSIQATLSQAATNATYFQWGWSTNLTGDMYVDDLVCCSSGDAHPLSNIEIVPLKPTADGTHVAGTNIMENQAGTDLGTAWSLINDAPPDAADYIRQAAVGTGNYAEVTFENLTPSHSAVVAAKAILSYTSETTTGNNGGCIVSKDNFSSSTTVFGVTGSLADYSDGSTANLFYKSAMISGVNDDTTVNALAARVGFSGDATPDPYWVDLIIEAAYTPSSGTLYTQSASGGITPSGALSRQVNKVASGSLSSSGALSRLTSKVLSGALTSSGALARMTGKIAAGTLTSSGALVAVRLFFKSIEGSLTPSGSLSRIPSKLLAGTMTSAGTVIRSVSKFVAGTFSSAGALSTSRGYTRSFDGAMTPAGTVARQTSKPLAGNLSPAGALSKIASKIVSGSLAAAGALTRLTNKIVAGALSLAGAIETLFTGGGGNQFTSSVGGTLTSSGAIVRDTIKSVAGALSPAGSLSKIAAKLFGGSLAPAGTTTKNTAKATSGTIAAAGSISKQIAKAFAGSISPTGALAKMAQKVLEGSLASAGSMARAILKLVSGSLAPGGAVNKFITKTFAGSLSMAGVLVSLLASLFQPTARIFHPSRSSIGTGRAKGITASRADIDAADRKDVSATSDDIQSDAHRGDK